MKDKLIYLSYGSYLISYTFIYHGLYYCPPISKKFDKLLLLLHGK